MFTFNSYLKLRYWLRERIILWGFGRKRVTGYRGRGFGLLEGWRVIKSERWRAVWGVGA